MDTKSLGDIVAKWTSVTPQRASFFTAGVARTPVEKFQTNASAAAPNYAAGVQQAIADNRFATRVATAGTRWKNRVADVGGGRFSEGVSKGGPAYQAGFGPFLNTLQGLTLAPRGPRGDPRNIQRVAEIATALYNQRRTAVRA